MNDAPMVRASEVEAKLDEIAPRVLPPGWRLRQEFANARIWLWTRPSGDRVSIIAEIADYEGALWFHVSASGGKRVPTWYELREIKDVVIGKDRLALQVLPNADEYVNIDPNVLHLWAPLEGARPIPDFRKWAPELGRQAL